ncbi:thiamine biosynthesis protein ThiJ [Brevibacillus fluminis]|uniref:Thiamine biosynthesis protein ThiJ n=1 Tax=Brevibacillus fluminis TaxID=511487 RepID=A0A3M8DNG8_9BACL|nr:DJ-1/PfpI family protein [Brevibacillus fluminis]RNB89554.1 thiamine biosynthesis protein ThiJ [Brevibacillus fluminis]
MGTTIALVVFDDFTDLDLFLPWDLLNRVRLVGGRDDWQVKIVGTEATHVSQAGLRIPTTGFVEEAVDADAVLFTSGPRVPALIEDGRYMNRFSLSPERQLIGSMCSGALFLAKLGLLTGMEATTYPTRRKLLASMGAKVVDRGFVENGNVATAAGCLAGQDLSAWIIRTLADQAMVDSVIDSVLPVEQMVITK